MSSVKESMARFTDNEFGNINRKAQRRETKTQYQDSSQDRLLKLASNFNTKLSEELVAKAEERKEKENIEALALADEYEMERMENEGISSITSEKKAEYEEGKKQLNEHKTQTQDAAREILDETGDYDLAKKIRGLGGDALFTFTARRSVVAGKNYKAWLEGEMLKNDELTVILNGKEFTPKKANTLQKKQVAMKELRKEYIKLNNLTGVSAEIKAEKGGFFETAIVSQSELYQQYKNIDAVERSFKDKEDAKDTFRDANHSAKEGSSFNDLYQAIRLTVDPKNPKKALTNEQALDETIKVITGQMDTGEFGQTDLDAMGEQLVKDPTTGEMKPLKKVWPTRYLKLQEALDEAVTENDKVETAKEKAAASKAQKDVLGQTKDMDEKEVIRFLRSEQSKLQKKYPGYEFSMIDKHVKNFAKGDAYLIQLGEAEEKMRNGTLTLKELSKFSSQIQNDERFSKFATQLTNAQAGGPVKEYIEEINTAIAYKINQGGIDKKNRTVKPMERYTRTKFDAFLATAIANEHPNPADFARQATLSWLDTYTSSRKNFNETGYINIPGTLTKKQLKKSLKLHNAEVKRQKEVLDEYKETILTKENIGKLIDKEELITSLGDYLKTNANPASFDYPGEIDTLYNHLADGKRSKFDIMNDVLQLHGLPTLGNKPPSIEKFDNNASKADNVTIWNKTFPSSSRVWGLIASKEGLPNLELFPNGLGEEVFKWSEENNFDYGDIAASTEFFTANPSIAFNYGLTEEDLGALTIPPSTSGAVNWDRVGEAAGKFKLHMITRTKDIGRELIQTGINMKDFFGEGYNWLGENTVEFANTINQIVESGVSDAMNIDAGNVLQESLVEPLTQTPQILEDEASNAINDVINQYLGDAPELTDEDICNYQLSQYKQTGDISHCPIRK